MHVSIYVHMTHARARAHALKRAGWVWRRRESGVEAHGEGDAVEVGSVMCASRGEGRCAPREGRGDAPVPLQASRASMQYAFEPSDSWRTHVYDGLFSRADRRKARRAAGRNLSSSLSRARAHSLTRALSSPPFPSSPPLSLPLLLPLPLPLSAPSHLS
eukprot:6188007-Pleurochrysis_carterae.AAC.2